MFRLSSLALCVTLCFVASCKPLGGDAEVEASVLIVKKDPVDVLALAPRNPNGAQGYVEDYIATQMAIIRSPAIIGRAVKMPNLVDLTRNDADTINTIRNALTVRRDGDKENLITITWKGADPQKGKLILDGILISYQAFLDETYKTVSDHTLELIMEAKRKLSQNLQQAEQDYMDFRQKNPFLNYRGDQTEKMKHATLSALLDKKAANMASRAELEGRLAWAQNAVNNKDEMLAFQLKVNEWASRSGFDKLPKESRQGLESHQAYINVLKQDLAENQAIRKGLNDAIDEEQNRLRDLQNYEHVEERLRNAIASQRTLFDSIVKRLQEVNLVKDDGGYEARVVSPPQAKK